MPEAVPDDLQRHEMKNGILSSRSRDWYYGREIQGQKSRKENRCVAFHERPMPLLCCLPEDDS